MEAAVTAAERMVFEAQIDLDAGHSQKAGKGAYLSMIKAAKALVLMQYDDVTDDPDEVVEEFKERYYDSKLIFDPFAGGKFANYLFTAHRNTDTTFTPDSTHRIIEEALLFIEAVHGCYNRIRLAAAPD